MPGRVGVRCLNPRPLVFYHVGLDTSHNPTHLFWTDRVADEDEPQSIHANEVSGYEWVPLERCIDMVFEREIVDSFTIVGLLSCREFKGRT